MSSAISKLAQRLPSSVLLLASSPTIAAAPPEQAAAAVAPPETEPLDALVVVRVDMDGGDEIAGLLHAQIVAALREARVEPELPDQAPLEVVVSPDLEGLGGYDVVYRHRGELRESWSCACSGDELRARLAHDTIDVWNALVAASPQAIVTPVLTAPADPDRLDPEPSHPRHERGLGLWISGVTTTAIGTGIVVGTTALLIAHSAEGRERSPMTPAVLGAGVASVAAGVTLWSIGSHRRKHPRLSVLPSIRSRGVLVTVGGSF